MGIAAGQDLALGLIAVADHVPAPLAISVVVLAQEDPQLSQNGLPNGALGTDQIGHLVAEGWIDERNCRIVTYGGILLACKQ